MSQVGSYRGVYYIRKRLCDVFPFMDKPLRTQYWFTCMDPERPHEPDGSYYSTIREMQVAIDKELDT